LETLVSIVGGVGLFLLGMAVMTDGLKALAGTALKTVMEKAAATPLLGTFWGAVITLIVQSSSATTMTTIGLVSAGLLTFPQGLSLVFGANIGTTGTGWLVAAFGVRISLTAAALPIVFVGALLKVVGRGRLAAAGAAIAGFALILVGLSTLQQGMGGLAQSLHPSDLPTITNAAGAEAYPICGFTWLLVHPEYSGDIGKTITDFLHWYLTEGEGMAKELYYAPLPEALIKKVEKKIEMVK